MSHPGFPLPLHPGYDPIVGLGGKWWIAVALCLEMALTYHRKKHA
ncbi:hypothetical protein [Silvimonas soli]|nr:hypothetical protein [Silvimonas soli]